MKGYIMFNPREPLFYTHRPHKAVLSFAIKSKSRDVACAKMAVVACDRFLKIHDNPEATVKVMHPGSWKLQPWILYRDWECSRKSQYNKGITSKVPPPGFQRPNLVWPIPFPPLEEEGTFEVYETGCPIQFRLSYEVQSFEEAVQWVWEAFDNLPTPHVKLTSVEEDRVMNYG